MRMWVKWIKSFIAASGFIPLWAMTLFAVLLTTQAHAGLLDFLRESPQVTTDQGVIEGFYARTSALGSERDMAKFFGIPFAAPPVGENRWREPQPPAQVKGVFKAKKTGSEPLQPSLVPGQIIGSEDCLYMNIWVPKTRVKGPLPVMFWIHGGAFIMGSGNQKIGAVDLYEASQLAKKGDVIVVSANYRLGPMGFFAHPDLAKENVHGSTGNYGLLDQIAALKWVQRNIERFGGDPSRVTVFGESAGGASVLSLIASPLAKGLFSRAIVQSGPDFSMSKTKAMAQGERMADSYSLSVSEMRKVDGAQITKDFPLLVSYGKTRFEYGPVVDGYVLPETVLESMKNQRHNSVPLIIGTNADEMKVLGPIFLYGVPKDLTDDAYVEYVRQNFGDEYVVEAQKKFTRQVYGNNRAALEALLEAGLFQNFADQVVKTLKQTSTYKYLFNQKISFVGAGHGVELAYTFQNKALLYGLNYKILNPLSAALGFQRQMELSDLMIKYWTNFAHSGNPNTRDGVEVTPLSWKPVKSGQVMQFSSAGSQMCRTAVARRSSLVLPP